MPERVQWNPAFVDCRAGLCVETIAGTTFSAALHSGRGGVLIDDKEVVVGSQGENWRVVRLGESAVNRGDSDLVPHWMYYEADILFEPDPSCMHWQFVVYTVMTTAPASRLKVADSEGHRYGDRETAIAAATRAACVVERVRQEHDARRPQVETVRLDTRSTLTP